MKHLKPFMESAGSMWRQVDRAEMERKMRGKVIDTITKAEIQKVIDLLKETGRNIDLIEYKMDAKNLDINLFGKPVKTPLVGARFQVLRRHYDKLNKKIGFVVPQLVEHPRMATNNLYIVDYSIPIEIFKCEDDYFWVSKSSQNTNRQDFICDGIQGLLSMLADYYTIEKKNNL
jgi:hypothetical protein